MGVVAGDAGKFAPLAQFRRVGFVGDRMTAAVAEGKDMNRLADRFMTGKTELIDGLMELLRILTVVAVMTDFAHAGGYGAMEKLE